MLGISIHGQGRKRYKYLIVVTVLVGVKVVVVSLGNPVVSSTVVVLAGRVVVDVIMFL